MKVVGHEVEKQIELGLVGFCRSMFFTLECAWHLVEIQVLIQKVWAGT